MIAYENDISADTHVAIVKGDVSEKGGPDPVLVRVHSECLTGDAFWFPALRLRQPACRRADPHRKRKAGARSSTCVRKAGALASPTS